MFSAKGLGRQRRILPFNEAPLDHRTRVAQSQIHDFSRGPRTARLMQILSSRGRTMDWFSTWDPVFYEEIDQVDPAVDTGRLTAWLILAVVALAVAALWYCQRVFRPSFWVAATCRDGEV